MNLKNKNSYTLFFIHIPKTAGTTLSFIMDEQYNSNNVFAIDGGNVKDSTEQFKNLPDEEKNKYNLVWGHMNFGVHKALNKQSTYITLLRDPVDRLISHYYFAKQTPHHYLYNKIKLYNMDLKGYVMGGLTNEADNGQVRDLSGIEDIEFGKCSQEILEIAKKNIEEHFSLVGLTERFGDTLKILRKKFGWKIDPFYPKQRVNDCRPKKEMVEKNTVKIIENFNRLDVELYKWCKERFEVELV